MSNKSRRKLLKHIAAGSGAIVAGKNLPESWTRPVVESVILPAHAGTSRCTDSGTVTVTFSAVTNTLSAATNTLNIDLGFTDEDGTYDTSSGAISINFGVPGGCSGDSSTSGTVLTPEATPSGLVSGNTSFSYTCNGSEPCEGTITFSATSSQGNGVYTGTWFEDASPICCEIIPKMASI